MLPIIPKLKINSLLKISYKNIETGKISQYTGICILLKKKHKFYHITLQLNFDKNIVEIIFVTPSPLIQKIEVLN